MNDDHFCCNGKCTQGRNCPRYKHPPMSLDDKITLVLGLLGIVLFCAFVFGYFYGAWRYV